MIKKSLVTCSVILVLVIVSKLFICSTTIKKNGTTVSHFSRFAVYKNDANSELNFANETMPANAAVKRKIKHSLWKSSFSNVQSNVLHQKAEKLFPIIEPILALYGIPEDFKYIPLVESGLSEGVSAKGASGIWQFMPGTARHYGLKVGHGRDERLNIRKSTYAACKYIKELYGQFHNWTLTAAAYNNGEIKLARAIRKQNNGNYYQMNLNRETGSYVYNLIAMKEVISNPRDYGYKNAPAPVWFKPNQLLAIN